jgi:hypothetical protein
MKSVKILIPFLILLAATPAFAGKILVANDEWPLKDSTWDTNAAQFERNILTWFGAQSGDRFLMIDTSAWGSNFEGVMDTSGYSHTRTIASNISLATLQQYRGVFLTVLPWYPQDADTLASYVNGGGNVYIAGGTGASGSPSGEAGAYNPFLTQFGLAFDAVSWWNGIAGVVPINNAHPLFTGVSGLYQDNGLDVLLGPSPVAGAQVLVTQNGHGLYGVYESAAAGGQVPEPGAAWLAAGALLAVMGKKFGKRSRT